jgi:ketol-acid reductoisomerase
MAKIYYEGDADLAVLADKTIGVIGYGIQGRAQALCLRDSGLTVEVAELQGTESYEQAAADGFEPMAAADCAAKSQLVQILTEDHVQAEVYRNHIAPNLETGDAVIFSHGFNIHYKQIVPAADVDVFMIAPKGPGALVRECYEQGSGVPSLVAIHQDVTGKAMALALAYSKGLGATRAGVIETTFKEETETDLFGEQAVLCGGVCELIKAGWETLVEAGYQPEIAYFECLHELKLIMDLIYRFGISGMRKRVSDTAEYGDMIAGKQIITKETRETMRKLLDDVQSGVFAREWILENQAGRPSFSKLEELEADHPIDQVGDDLRGMMSWMDE